MEHPTPDGIGRENRGRSYNDAIKCLNSLQTEASVLEANRQAGYKSSGKEIVREALGSIGLSVLPPVLDERLQFLSVPSSVPLSFSLLITHVVLQLAEINNLNVLHVAGTKGKGTTCTFIEAILSHYGTRLNASFKTGLYTSPHVQFVRDRIRINSKSIPEQLFAKYFFEVWELVDAKQLKLGYFRFLTLLSFYIFNREGVNVAIYETGVGGEHDSTNVVQKPLATGIVSLGLDHTRTLGSTIEDIAWHKAGIFKAGCPAFTVPQDPAAEAVLMKRAAERGAPLSSISVEADFVRVHVPYPLKINMSLALAMANEFLGRVSPTATDGCHTIAKEILEGNLEIHLPGRFQTIQAGGIYWCLDVAHTAESLSAVGEWFAGVASQSDTSRVLVFYSDPAKRDSQTCLEALFKPFDEAGMRPQYVLFCTLEREDGAQLPIDMVNKNKSKVSKTSLEAQELQKSIWEQLDTQADVRVFPTLDGAHSFVRDLDRNKIRVLVTGSFHLVGGMLFLINSGRSLQEG